jgi:starch synthase (maltosyl-transferring)
MTVQRDKGQRDPGQHAGGVITRGKAPSTAALATYAGSALALPRIYYLHPRLAGPLERWPKHLDRIRAMGFAHVLVAWPFATDAEDLFASHDLDRLPSALGHDGTVEQAFRLLAQSCRARGLQCHVDLVIDRAAEDGVLAASLPGCWQPTQPPWIDPRAVAPVRIARADFDAPESRERLVRFWQKRLIMWQSWGIAGVRCHAVATVPLEAWREILAPAHGADPAWFAIGWMTGRPRGEVAAAAAIFDCVPSSAAWWDGHAAWLVEEYRAISRVGRLLAFPDDPFGRRLAARCAPGAALASHRLALQAASTLADGWLVPMGFEYGAYESFLQPLGDAADFASLAADAPFDLSAEIAAANARMTDLAATPGGVMRMLSTDGSTATMVHRGAGAEHGVLVLVNPDHERSVSATIAAAVARIGMSAADGRNRIDLPPGRGDVVLTEPAAPVIPGPASGTASAGTVSPCKDWSAVANRPRIAIEAISPAVDAGRFPVKRVVGDLVAVEADIFADGHEVLGAELRWRALDAPAWSTMRMAPVTNDRWRGEFPLLRPGQHVFAIEAWWDRFATFRRDLLTKRDAGLDLALEIAEGRLMLEHTLSHASADGEAVIRAHLDQLDPRAKSDVDPTIVLLSEALRGAMGAADPRPFATGRDTLIPIEADREAAAFASWYELFPRSQTQSRSRHGTFDDVIARLPAIRDMGFDVVYFPPIHPIGLTNRKGPNNSLTVGPDDPGSPYAIGSAEGGHDAIHPLLGSRDDFRRLVEAARRYGLEIALDFAIQCSPDHPWLTQHPDWFQWRPDGSMKYAENPPKKYQDIVNVEFYAEAAKSALWLALRDTVQSWVDEGVRMFRVDNPHTKPFPFWEWLIGDIRARDPGVIFLAEAFTRPKVMYRLGKVGFTQSYSYFTWRNDKAELAAYLTELNTVPARDLYRPNFFVNTPDINPFFLQTSGRAGFLIRAALAATLSGLWGVYSGFELCEAAALPGREEYLDSEKYEIRVRDWNAPGNIIAEITRLNEIRRSHRALQSHLGVTFYPALNDNVLYYGKRAPGDRDMILVAISLDPHTAQTASIEIPLWEFGLPDDASLAVEDLMFGARFVWAGKHQTINFDPTRMPFSIWRVVPYGDI